ncbi:MAG: response regulator [Limnochordaceae bacterium]|uniref:Response regulator n=1 Tax=Carboxydichorda subterranea TaxID=3109565 RepID=A0ABZ1BYU6_9FIRM|nr:response regulator [Limnochorda sp. L945t]MBE3598769.1 response regulator [Limnochordaceae bacterium]WRP17967.1 response regulator [Limnochorda sp. L945t]
MGLSALIVDDEQPARLELAHLLQQVTPVDTLDEAGTMVDALARLQEKRYDLVFLDIRMPGVSGLEAMQVINRLPDPPPVIFVTAYDEHALAAFEVGARDYLLKPVSEARLRLTLGRLLDRRRENGLARVAHDRLPVEQEGHTRLVRVADIRFIHVRGHTVYVRTFDAEWASRASLAELADRLAPQGFVRVHRAYLVNPEHVLEVHPFFAGTYILRMDDRGNSEVPVSRSSARLVREIFGL